MENEKTKKREPASGGIRLGTFLRRRAQRILLAGVLAACIAFAWATFLVAPVYASSVTVYVNGSGLASDEPQKAANTYLALLQTRVTLQEVLKRAGRVDTYSQEQLSGMLCVSPVRDSEVYAVTVTADDPEEAKRLVNAIAEVLPERVEEVMEGASMRVVDEAAPYAEKIRPGAVRYLAIGFLAGLLLMTALVLLQELWLGVVDEKYLLKTYDLPVLARVPKDS